MTLDLSNTSSGIEFTGVSRLNVIENTTADTFEATKKWILDHSFEYIYNLIVLALDIERYKALDKLFDILEIPNNLTIKERISYYQLLGD